MTFVSCSGGKNNTGYSIINDLMYSEAYEAFSENNTFEDGNSMQQPPANVIARGFLPYRYADSDGVKAGEELVNPHEVTEEFLERGAYLYNMACAVCHGPEGKGDGPVVSKGMPMPPSYTSRRVRRYKVGHIYHVITVGYGNMASHAQQLYPEDRWAVAEYVKQKLIEQ